MATSNLRARLERLERQQGPTGEDPVIVVMRHFGEFEQGPGVFVDGLFYACPPGTDVDELERKVIADVNRDRSRKLIVVQRAEPAEFE
ncbi:hypothetical protein [Paraburkholderia mimosarum]|uniref:hypothetical protein n=1 Tax=Paraburkholderia mimosarum TaxID=312026 RepID=UPI000414D7A7|nr:hypothetical protein [Paraburkholderia mimosarum]